MNKDTFFTSLADEELKFLIKYFVIEYGRPGKKGKTTDKKGRRIGRVQPFSHKSFQQPTYASFGVVFAYRIS